jgi:hypothetical protein
MTAQPSVAGLEPVRADKQSNGGAGSSRNRSQLTALNDKALQGGDRSFRVAPIGMTCSRVSIRSRKRSTGSSGDIGSQSTAREGSPGGSPLFRS